MIAKQIKMRSRRKSSYKKLIEYLLDPKDKRERVGTIQISNCHSRSPNMAILEVLNTQFQNTRSQIDKTCHLILSFQAGDEISPEDLKKIEEHFCNELGYGEHQRISVVHQDTDNLHIHIAINKVHPQTYKTHTPYNNYRTLSRCCEYCEEVYGLKPDNHTVSRTVSANRAADMESRTGQQSLQNWIKTNCLEELKNATSWEELHEVLGVHGLEIKARGNGFIFTDGTVRVKASSVYRDLSKNRLEAKLGTFVENSRQYTVRKRYNRPALNAGTESQELYKKYTEYRNESEQRKELKIKHKAAIEAAKRDARRQRSLVKLLKGKERYAFKQLRYRQISNALQSKIEKINKDYLKEFQVDKSDKLVWLEWLRKQAFNGDSSALRVLRSRTNSTPLTDNCISGTTTVYDGVVGRCDSVTKQGTVIYSTGRSSVRDNGQALYVTDMNDGEAVLKAVKLALARYGNTLSVTGDASFKKKIVETVVGNRELSATQIFFKDRELEDYKKTLIRSEQRQSVSMN